MLAASDTSSRDIIKKLPKRRGFGKNRGRTVNARNVDVIAIPVNLLNGFSVEVNRKSLVERGVVNTRGGKIPSIKIVGGGALVKAIKVSGVPVSAGARSSIEKAGGTIT